MARRGFAILFTLLGIAFFISIVGFAILYFMFGREPAVPSNATLVLRVGGDLSEMAPADVVGYLRGVRTPTVRSVVDNLRKAKADGRVRAVLLKPTGFESPFWGKVQEIRDAVGLSRTARTRESTFAFRRLSTMARTVGVFDPRKYPTKSAGASSVSDPPTRRTSVAFDGTAGSRPNRR